MNCSYLEFPVLKGKIVKINSYLPYLLPCNNQGTSLVDRGMFLMSALLTWIYLTKNILKISLPTRQYVYYD